MVRVVLAGVVLAVVSGCASSATPSGRVDPDELAGRPPAAAAAAPGSGGVGFLADVREAGAPARLTDEQLLLVGRLVCAQVGAPFVTHDTAVAQVNASLQDPGLAAAVVTAAEQHICPGQRYTR